MARRAASAPAAGTDSRADVTRAGAALMRAASQAAGGSDAEPASTAGPMASVGLVRSCRCSSREGDSSACRGTLGSSRGLFRHHRSFSRGDGASGNRDTAVRADSPPPYPHLCHDGLHARHDGDAPTSRGSRLSAATHASSSRQLIASSWSCSLAALPHHEQLMPISVSGVVAPPHRHASPFASHRDRLGRRTSRRFAFAKRNARTVQRTVLRTVPASR